MCVTLTLCIIIQVEALIITIHLKLSNYNINRLNVMMLFC